MSYFEITLRCTKLYTRGSGDFLKQKNVKLDASVVSLYCLVNASYEHCNKKLQRLKKSSFISTNTISQIHSLYLCKFHRVYRAYNATRVLSISNQTKHSKYSQLKA